MKPIIRRPGLIELNAHIDSVLQFQRDEDDKSGGGFGLGTGAVVGAGGLGATAGLYGAGVAAQRTAGGMGTNIGQIGSAAKGDISAIGQGGLGRIGRTIGTGASVASQAGGNLVQNIIAKARGLKLSAPATNLIELNMKIDDVLEFREEEESHRLRNAALIGAGAAGAGVGGAYHVGHTIRRGIDSAGVEFPGGRLSHIGTDLRIGGAVGMGAATALANRGMERGRSAYGAAKGRASAAGKRVSGAASGTKAALQAQLDKALAKLAKLRK